MHFLFVSKCIKIPVKRTSSDVIVPHVSTLTSSSINVDQVSLSKLEHKGDIVFSIIVYWQMWKVSVKWIWNNLTSVWH